jgi:hypothetical protein
VIAIARLTLATIAADSGVPLEIVLVRPSSLIPCPFCSPLPDRIDIRQETVSHPGGRSPVEGRRQQKGLANPSVRKAFALLGATAFLPGSLARPRHAQAAT